MTNHVRTISCMLLALFTATTGLGSRQPTVCSSTCWTALDVAGDDVRIYRDEFGVPHIFADTNRGLFEGYGYAVAEDRLWQLELFRRAAQGRLSEIFGDTVVVTNLQNGDLTALAADRDIRTRFYTQAEIQEQVDRLDPEEADIFDSYARGINRYLTDVVARDPAAKLPLEFHVLGIGMPALWTSLDVAANAIYQSRFGQVGGMERRNQTLLSNLIARHGSTRGMEIFNDIRWVDDPDAPVTIPADGALGKRQKAETPAAALPDQLLGASDVSDSLQEQADAVLTSLGVPITTGSHGWVVSAARSANGSAMLYGGPQVGFNTPELFHEVQLKGGEGFDVTGRAFAGVPIIFSGRTDHLAWTMTTGTFGDTRDVYVETLCGGGTGYVFQGACLPFESRVEVIDVKNAAPVTLLVRRSVHGPVVETGPGVVFTQKRLAWKRELESERAFLTLNRARNLQEFDAAVRRLEICHNVLYGDKLGNIAYWLSGNVPIRPYGFDPRLPLPGTGTAEWTGEFRPVPYSANPTRGWLSSWNTKPMLGYPNPDQRSFGKQYRSIEIDQRLENRLITLDDMKDIEKDIARTEEGGDGRESRYLKPYLFAALDHVPPKNELAVQAREVVAAWDGSLFADAIASETLEPGHVIFDTWLDMMTKATFGDELGPEIGRLGTPVQLTNMLIHVLDDALGAGSGVVPSRDYFNGADPNVVMSAAFDRTLTALGSDPAVWSGVPRDVVRFRHTLYPTIPEAGTLLNANRGTYAMVVVLSNPALRSESILSLGQSGFIQLESPDIARFHAHFRDQLEIYRQFKYKPMHLYRNRELKE